MPKTIQSILIFVCIGCFIPFSTAQDAFDKTVEKIKVLEGRLEQNRKDVDQKTVEFRKNQKDNAPMVNFTHGTTNKGCFLSGRKWSSSNRKLAYGLAKTTLWEMSVIN